MQEDCVNYTMIQALIYFLQKKLLAETFDNTGFFRQSKPDSNQPN